MMPALPFIPGVEASGVVEDANGSDFKPGQKVTLLGVIGTAAYAEYIALDADKLIALPDDSDLAAAAVVPVNYFTAYHMIHNVCRAESHKTALIYAASGGVGTALIQLSKRIGLKVVALERKSEKVENAIKLGADYAFDTSQENWVSQVEAAIGENAVHYVFNPVANDSAKNDLRLLATRGHIVIFGFLAGIEGVDLQKEAFAHFGKSPTLTFSEIYATYNTDFSIVRDSLESLYDMLDKNEIKPIYETMPMQAAKEAHDKLQQGRVRGKLLLLNT